MRETPDTRRTTPPPPEVDQRDAASSGHPPGHVGAPRALAGAREAHEQPGAAATHGHQEMAHGAHAAPGAHGRHGPARPGGADHADHAGHSAAMFARRFWVCLALTLPVVFYAGHIQMLLGYTAPAFPGAAWLEPVLGASSTGTAAGST